MGVVRQLRAQDSPYLQAVVELLAPRAMDYMFDQRDFNDTASQLLDCLRGAADAALRARWAGWFLDSFAAFVERHRGRDWKMDWTVMGKLMGQDLQSFGQVFAVQLDSTRSSEDPYWLDVGQRLVRMYMSAQNQEFQQECLAQFMVQWLDAEGPWRGLGLDEHHPLAMAMAQHPRVRREGLLDVLRQAASSLRERTTGRWPGPWPPVGGLPPALVQERSHQPVRCL